MKTESIVEESQQDRVTAAVITAYALFSSAGEYFTALIDESLCHSNLTDLCNISKKHGLLHKQFQNSDAE